MLVYGDVERIESVGTKQEKIETVLRTGMQLPSGLERHAGFVEAFIGASELVQGVVDAEFEERGFDTWSAYHEAGMRCLTLLARCIDMSWRTGFRSVGPIDSPLKALFQFDPSLSVQTKQAEGYAFYALYPESYLEAAARSGLRSGTQVIGIRSIGASLGALVAGALKTVPPLTVRPVGHPFHREVKVEPALAAEITGQAKIFAIVDEGPGLSGSSFGAVADWLERAGVPQDRIHFFPSHRNDLGPQASGRHRDRWGRAIHHSVSMDGLLLRSPGAHHLRTWIEDVTGPLKRPLDDISGGAWREKHYGSEAEWPPANIQQERRKFLGQGAGASWLVKFSGLGEAGRRKLQYARILHEAGFTSETLGYRHGFLIERWQERGRPLDQADIDRRRLVERIGSYLGFRARHFPAPEEPGAAIDELEHMAVYNTEQALGAAAALELKRALSKPTDLHLKIRRIRTDNRMHAWEWLVLDDRLLKTDALDHSATHDLVGHQDVAWDIAGAMAELMLSNEETERLCAVVEQEAGYAVRNDVLSFMYPCYLAFQLGSYVMSADSLAGTGEAPRLRRSADRYAALLTRMIRKQR